MDTQQFKYALEVERTGSISRAAEKLYMGQSNLSKSIKDMEDEVGFAIFDRTPRGVVPTKKGKVFLNYAKSILLDLNEMKTVCLSDNKDIKLFNVCVPRGSYASYVAINFLADLDKDKPMNAHFGETPSIEGIEMVAEGVFNIGVVRYQVEYEKYFNDYFANKGLHPEIIWEYESVVIMSSDNPLASSDKLKISDLEPYTEITHGDCSVPYINVAQSENASLSEFNGRVVNLYKGTNQYLMLSMMPDAFMWVSPTPPELLEKYSLVQKSCESGAHRFRDLIIRRKDYKMTETDLLFMDKLYSVKNRLAIH